MKKFALALALALLILLSGCYTTPKEEFVDGVSVQIGLYIPVSGSLYGLQVFSYLSGTKVTSTKTNSLDIAHQHAITNSFFGSTTAVRKDTDIK